MKRFFKALPEFVLMCMMWTMICVGVIKLAEKLMTKPTTTHPAPPKATVQEQGDYVYIAPVDKAIIEMRQQE